MIDITTYDNIIDSFLNLNNLENKEYLHQDILSLSDKDVGNCMKYLINN